MNKNNINQDSLDFEFPISLGEFQGEDQTKNKSDAQIKKYLRTVSDAIIQEPNKINECTMWLDFLYFCIKTHNQSAEISDQLSDIIKILLDNTQSNNDMCNGAKRIGIFLACCYLCWNKNNTSNSHIKLLKSFVKCLKYQSQFIPECFSSIITVATSNVHNLQAHQIVLILLKINDDEQSYFESLVNAFSAPNISCVTLLRRLDLQAVEGEDEETRIRFQELIQGSNQTFIEEVIKSYILQMKPMYAKINREILTEFVKHLPDIFKKKQILHSVLQLFDKDYYMIRNSATIAIGEMLKKQIFEENQENQIMQLLLTRTYDSHVHGRSCALYTLRDLVAFTNKLNQEFLFKAVERLKDKSSSVRRAAIALLDTVIQKYGKQLGSISFRPSLLERNLKALEQEKLQLFEQCQRFKETVEKGQDTGDLRGYFNKLEESVNSTKEREKLLVTQQTFQEQIKLALPDLSRIALSNIQTESKGVLQLYQRLIEYNQEGMIQEIKKILVLVYQSDEQEEVIKLIYDQFAKKHHYKLIRLIESCDLLEITCLEQVFKLLKSKNIQLKTNEAWENFKQQKQTLSNLRIIRFIGIINDPLLGERLSLLLKHLQQTKQFAEITEIIKIISEIPNEDVHQIFIKDIINQLHNFDGDDLEWFKACDQFIRFIVEKMNKPEITLKEFLQAIPKENIPQLMFASSTIGLKLYVYSEKLIKIFMKEKDQAQDEIEQMDSTIQEHLQERIKCLQEVFEKLGSETGYSLSAEKICKNIIQDQYKERNQMIDQIAVIALLLFMIISKKCAERNIELIMELLECSQVSSIIKCTIISMLSDLYYRHSSIIDITKLLSKMEDKTLKVKRTAIIIVSHLMLMELLKIDASQIAKHINDSDITIRKHAKIFFVELYKKDSVKFQQVLPDLITSMAHNYQVTEEDFKVFAKEVIPIIQKDKIQEALLQKFLERFEIFEREASIKNRDISARVSAGKDDIILYNPTQLSSEKECIYLSYCLLHLKFHLENLRLLVNTFPSYKKILKHPIILEAFKQIFQRCLKAARSIKMNAKKPEAISQSHETDQLINIFRQNLITPEQAQFSTQQLQQKPKRQNTQFKTKKPPKQPQLRISDSSDTSSMEIEL